MVKTHPRSKIVQFHHESKFAEGLLSHNKNSEYITLQIEPVEHSNYDFIAEIVKQEDYIGEEK
jgi:hypothetical protein